jgi:hypothetical protein
VRRAIARSPTASSPPAPGRTRSKTRKPHDTLVRYTGRHRSALLFVTIRSPDGRLDLGEQRIKGCMTPRRGWRAAESDTMKTKTALFCLGPAAKGALEVRQVPRRNPAADEVEVAVEAASVNPIDVRRARPPWSTRSPPSSRSLAAIGS